jgi:hypothetical protein
MRTPRRHRGAALLVAALSVASLGAAVAPTAALAGFTSTSLSATAPISGLGVRWSLTLDADGGDIMITVQRKNADGTGRAALVTRTDTSTLDCTASLKSCVLSDEASLGTYGVVDLAFAATAPRTAKERKCAGSDTIRAIEYRRKGLLSGKLRVDTKTDLVGVVRAGNGAHKTPASIPTTVTRVVPTGAKCPKVPPAPCVEEVQVSVSTTLGAPSLSANRRVAAGPTHVRWNEPLDVSEPAVTRYQFVEAKSPASALAVNSLSTLNSATLEISGGAPYLDGGLLFAASSPKASAFVPSCDTAEKRLGAVLPSITVKFPWEPLLTLDDETDATLYHVID